MEKSEDSKIVITKSGDETLLRSSFSYIFNINEKPIWILNFPYIDDDRLNTYEINSYILNLVQVYFLLFVLAIMISYLVSSYITNPISALIFKMKQMRLDKINKKIDLKVNSKEMYSLVNSYNNMVTQIDNNVKKLSKSQRELAWREMAKQVAHEIKNPLTPMLLSTEFIESQLEDEELINSIKSIKRQIFLIQNLVNEFSTYARLPKANITKLNLSEICLVYIEEYKRNYDKIDINYNIEDNLFVNFDHSYLDIIFNNLFKNSIEALETTNNPAIDITLKKTDKMLILTFFDNGPGYDGDIDDLIKPYFSTKNSSGLGLSLINKIITDNSYKMNITTNSYSGFKIEIIFYD